MSDSNRPENNNNSDDENNSLLANLAMKASWAVNWFLFFGKLFCVIFSGSKSIIAALTDSAVDLLSQAILSLAEHNMSRDSPFYPIGRARLEALAVLCCSGIMIAANIEVIQFSIVDLKDGLEGNIPHIELGVAVYTILSIGIALKFILFFYCRWASKFLSSDLLEALAEDHVNDVFSNIAALITASIAFNVPRVWWLDPAGAILISLVIIWRWFSIVLEQMKKIVGHTAPPEFIEEVEALARDHDKRIEVDVTRAYHFGSKFNVEMEIVLPGNMLVFESHDIALDLQHKIEGLDSVERAFVHVDHLKRDGLEHKVERRLATAEDNNDPSPSTPRSQKDDSLRTQLITADELSTATPTTQSKSPSFSLLSASQDPALRKKEGSVSVVWKEEKDLEWSSVNGSEHPPLPSGQEETWEEKLAMRASWVVNWFLLIGKLFCVIFSGSKSIVAALTDSVVDIVSQGVLQLSHYFMNKGSALYPIGRSRLEALGVLICAFIMIFANVEVIQFSIEDLQQGILGHLPRLDMGAVVYSIITIGVFLKLALYFLCKYAISIKNSDILEALAEDHLNDVFSNIAALITASIAFNVPRVWWLDPAGAILISLVIVGRWFALINEQAQKIVGHTAPPKFIEEVEALARDHDKRIEVDVTRVYQFGSKYNVEMEIVLPGSMTVSESHDIALALQHKIEGLEDMERAFVHVDYQKRDGLEHKVERDLARAALEAQQKEQQAVEEVSTLRRELDQAKEREQALERMVQELEAHLSLKDEEIQSMLSERALHPPSNPNPHNH